MSMGAGEVASVAVIGGFAVYWTADLLAGHWRKNRADERADALKRQMLDKGFTADEIAQAVAADPATNPTAQLSEALADGGIDAEAVGQIMNLLAQVPQPLRGEMATTLRHMAASDTGYKGKDLLKYIDARVEGLVEEPVPA